jgi:hypothetical protein
MDAERSTEQAHFHASKVDRDETLSQRESGRHSTSRDSQVHDEGWHSPATNASQVDKATSVSELRQAPDMLVRTNRAIISDTRRLHQSRLDNMGPKITHPQLVVNRRDLSTLKDIKAEQDKLAILNEECKSAEAPMDKKWNRQPGDCRMRSARPGGWRPRRRPRRPRSTWRSLPAAHGGQGDLQGR